MSSIRVSNIEAKADASSPTIDEKVKVTDSQGRVLMQVDGKTSGITTVGINTTGNTFTVDSNNGVAFSGIVTATGGFSGNVTGNVTGNLSGNVTGNATGLSGTPNITVGTVAATSLNASGLSTFSSGIQVGATTSIVIGSTFIRNNAVGLGQTTTVGRNAGVGTATGTLIYNTNINSIEFYNGNSWIRIQEIISATGGTILNPGNGYKYHIFTSSGDSFVVNNGSIDAEILIVAGGGGGGGVYGGGGGAGGVIYYGPSLGVTGQISGTSYPIPAGRHSIVIGAGGVAGPGSSPWAGGQGNNTTLGSLLTAIGGGYGGGNNSAGNPGGSGGGGSYATSPPTTGTTGTTNQGYGGGPRRIDTSPSNGGSGGGGAGGSGTTAPYTGSADFGGQGGNGGAYPIFAAPFVSPVIPAPNQPVIGPTGLYAGGGGGGSGGYNNNSFGGPGGPGGGGTGGSQNPGIAMRPGNPATGYGSGGGGGSGGGAPPSTGGSGSDGIVIIRYQT